MTMIMFIKPQRNINHMIDFILKLHTNTNVTKPTISKVPFLPPLFTVIKPHSFTTISLQRPQISQSVVSSLVTEKKQNLGFNSSSVKNNIVFKFYTFSPETARRFRRFSELKPEDVLELLLGFQCSCGNSAIGLKKVEALWDIFIWASDQNEWFKHLPRSYEIMGSMLVDVGLYRNVDILLSKSECEGILLGNHEKMLKCLIEGYIGGFELDRAMVVYTRMTNQDFVVTLSCYGDLLELLVTRNESETAIPVCMDMIGSGSVLGDVVKGSIENVVRLICRDGKLIEARNLVKKGVNFGLEPSNAVVNEIASGYCERHDYEDAIRFCIDVRRAPDLLVCNKSLASICSSFGTERAHWFLRELLDLGFVPDEVTLGILISWCCREGNIRNAFNYLSDILARGLKPDACSYNALMSGLFIEGMGRRVNSVFLDMIDRGISPKVSTFKVLLAGYCQYRQFDNAKVTIRKMERCGLVKLTSVEDPLSKAFTVLGLNPLNVKVKRDNHPRRVFTEFVDNLGNGLYLDTDVDEYEKIVTGVLKDSTVPDLNSLVMKECDSENLKAALKLVDEMARWGQKLSLSCVSTLVERLCASGRHFKATNHLFEVMPNLVNQLDHETLNLLLQTYIKEGFIYSAKKYMDVMIHRRLKIMNESYTGLLIGLCNNGESKYFKYYWDLARIGNWIPHLEACKALVRFLCQQKMINEALKLFESMVVFYPQLDVCNIFVVVFCDSGHTATAHDLVYELEKKVEISDPLMNSHLIRGFIKEKKLLEAFRVFDSMIHTKMVPSLDVSVLMIPLLCMSNRREQAFALKEVCLGEYYSVPPSIHSAFMNGFCKGCEYEKAVNLFKNMLAKGLNPDPEDYNILIQCHCQAKTMRGAEELLGVMIRKCVSLSLSSYRKMIQLTLAKGRVYWAHSAQKLMFKQNNFAPLIIYNILIHYIFSMQNYSLLHTVLAEMGDKGVIPDEVTYNFLVQGFYRHRDISSSLHYLKTMISMEHRPSARNFRELISALCGYNELGKALELCHEMEMRGYFQGSTIQNAIVERLISNGRLEEAENYLDRMERKGLIPDSINYDNLIKRFCLYKRTNKAVDLVNIMLVKGNIPNSGSYDSLILSFCSCNELDRAMDFLKEMLDMNLDLSTKTWGVLIDKLCKDGRTDEAEKIVSSMEVMGKSPTKEMYCCVINRYNYENNLNKASELVQLMQTVFKYTDFETHWSFISKLGSLKEDENSSSHGFLSTLLSNSGFSCKKNSDTKNQVYSVSPFI